MGTFFVIVVVAVVGDADEGEPLAGCDVVECCESFGGGEGDLAHVGVDGDRDGASLHGSAEGRVGVGVGGHGGGSFRHHRRGRRGHDA